MSATMKVPSLPMCCADDSIFAMDAAVLMIMLMAAAYF